MRIRQALALVMSGAIGVSGASVAGCAAEKRFVRSRATFESKPCSKAFFPADAKVDEASVRMRVIVEESGEPTDPFVLKEEPPGQGFGKAAQKCLWGARFRPGADQNQAAIRSEIEIVVRFLR